MADDQRKSTAQDGLEKGVEMTCVRKAISLLLGSIMMVAVAAAVAAVVILAIKSS